MFKTGNRPTIQQNGLKELKSERKIEERGTAAMQSLLGRKKRLMIEIKAGMKKKMVEMKKRLRKRPLHIQLKMGQNADKEGLGTNVLDQIKDINKTEFKY